MKQEEVDCLKINKLQEGKDRIQINKEIKRLRESQILFKEQHKELVSLRKQVDLFKEEKKKSERDIFKLKFDRDKERIEKREEKRNKLKENGDGDIKHLRRIMLVLSGKSPLPLSSLQEETFVYKEKKLLPCIKFLEDYNLIKSERDEKGIQRWFI